MTTRKDGSRSSTSSDEERCPLPTAAASAPPTSRSNTGCQYSSAASSSPPSDAFLVHDVSATGSAELAPSTSGDVPPVHPPTHTAPIITTESSATTTSTTAATPPSLPHPPDSVSSTTTTSSTTTSASTATTAPTMTGVVHVVTHTYTTLHVPYVISGRFPEASLDELVHTPISNVQCDIRRIRGGLLSKSSYELFVHGTNQFLLSGRKIMRSRSHLVSTDQAETAKVSKKYTGEVTSNFMGTEFQVHDYGTDPRLNADTPRSELVSISYTPAPVVKGPWQLCVLIPKIGHTAGSGSTLLQQFKEGHTDNLLQFQNVPPVWDAVHGTYTLDFHNRATRVSVKNFQLREAPPGDETVKLQLGRMGDDLFSLDFGYPFTPCQAFGIAISALGFKLALD
ncbi:tubby protein-like [Pelomyxa schiedti]|nr:tubby protein-like [Pelomyxa schiedti]